MASDDPFPRFRRMSAKAKRHEIQKRAVKRILPLYERQVKQHLSMGGTVDRRKGGYVKNTGKHLRRQDSNLIDSWTIRQVEVTRKGVQGVVSSSMEYAAIHEYGGVAGHGVLIPERSYARPAWKKISKKSIRILRHEHRKANR